MVDSALIDAVMFVASMYMQSFYTFGTMPIVMANKTLLNTFTIVLQFTTMLTKYMYIMVLYCGKHWQIDHDGQSPKFSHSNLMIIQYT